MWSSDSNSDSNSDKSDSENTDPDAVPEPDPDADSANEISSKASSEASNPPSSSRHPRGTTDLSAMSGLDLNLSKMEFSKAVKVAKAKADLDRLMNGPDPPFDRDAELSRVKGGLGRPLADGSPESLAERRTHQAETELHEAAKGGDYDRASRLSSELGKMHVDDCGSVLRDLKPETVQVRQATKNGEFEVCLTHLHCAATLGGPADEAGNLTGLIGTPEYCAPEVAIWFWHECVPPRLPEPPPSYGAKADVWALGTCLHVMLCGCFPFTPSAEEEELLRTINTAAFAFNDPGWRKVSEEALDLVGQLLARDPLDRPFLEEVLQHPFCGEALQEAMLQDEVASPQRGLDAAAFDRALEELDDDDDDDDDERPGQ